MPDAVLYKVEIIRKTLPTFGEAVSFVEAGGLQFIGNLVSVLDGNLVNLASFKPLSEEQETPNDPIFVEMGKEPGGSKILWTGVVLIDNSNIAVSMYR